MKYLVLNKWENRKRKTENGEVTPKNGSTFMNYDLNKDRISRKLYTVQYVNTQTNLCQEAGVRGTLTLVQTPWMVGLCHTRELRAQ